MLETKRPVIPAGQIEEVTQIAVEAIRKCVQIADKTNFDYSATVTALKIAIGAASATGTIEAMIKEEKQARESTYMNKLVVRCKHCKHCVDFPWTCELTKKRITLEDYCSYAYPKD